MTVTDTDSGFGPFDLAGPPSSLRRDFLVSDANSSAFSMISGDRWQDGRLVLTGPPSSGKSHLASIWSRESGAPFLNSRNIAELELDDIPAGVGLALDDADEAAAQPESEALLLHLLNFVFQNGGSVLLTANEPPARWPIGLPDLKSRLEAASLARVSRPDDKLLKGVLVKLFADRRVAVPPGVVEYVVSRMDRSFAEAARIVGEIDRCSLVEGRRISRRLAADVLNGKYG